MMTRTLAGWHAQTNRSLKLVFYVSQVSRLFKWRLIDIHIYTHISTDTYAHVAAATLKHLKQTTYEPKLLQVG